MRKKSKIMKDNINSPNEKKSVNFQSVLDHPKLVANLINYPNICGIKKFVALFRENRHVITRWNVHFSMIVYRFKNGRGTMEDDVH